MIPIVADSVSAFVFRRVRGALRVLLLKRAPDHGGFWQSVSGRHERGESPENTAVRETVEETGLKVLRTVPIEYVNTYYEAGKIHLEPCFGVEVGRGRARLTEEHVEHQWLGPAAAVRRLRWENNRRALEILLQELQHSGGSSSST